MNYRRADRVADLIRMEIADVLLKEVSDPRVRLVSITGVKITDDLRSAKIFFVEMGKDECSPETEVGIRKATGFLKRELGKRLKLRYLPEITFIYDESFAYGSRIDRLLAEIRTEEGTDDSADN
jgi:ribosome-binding factor A